MNKETARLGFYVALATVAVTIGTFIVAYLTPPGAGPLCAADCHVYPYLDISSRFPRDYYWMYPAIFLMVLYASLMAIVRKTAPEEKKVYADIGLGFAFIATAVLAVNYFIQVSVIQPSLLAGETDGVPFWSQFNPHGIFIALEEIGYIFMVLSYLFIAPTFTGKGRAERFARRIFFYTFIVSALAFTYFAAAYGISREYLFEIAIISAAWFGLIFGGTALAARFRKQLRA